MKTRTSGWVVVVAALALALPAAVWGAGDDPFLPRDPLQGQKLFGEKLCSRCHSIQGVGGSTGPDLGEIHLGSFMDIASKIWNHLPRMNEAFRQEKLRRPSLEPEEVRALVTFIYFLNYLDRSGNAEVGEKLFHEKNCIRCHSVGGKGGDVGPSLDVYQGRYAASFITAALWDNGPKMMETMHEQGVRRPVFQERDVIDILAFIRVKGLYDEANLNNMRPGDSVHGDGGEVGPDLAERPLKGSVSFILSEMWNHGATMWPTMGRMRIPFPRFTPKEMSDLMAYLYFIEFKAKAGSAAQGKAVFSAKRCAVCHWPSSPGAYTIGPDLSKAGLDDAFSILAAMWNHSPAIEARMKKGGIRWPLLDTDEMRNLVAYISELNRMN
jgi:cytochrome c2